MEAEKIASLTGMRGLFAMAILLFHWSGEFAYPADTILTIIYREGGNLGNAFSLCVVASLLHIVIWKNYVMGKKINFSF